MREDALAVLETMGLEDGRPTVAHCWHSVGPWAMNVESLSCKVSLVAVAGAHER